MPTRKPQQSQGTHDGGRGASRVEALGETSGLRVRATAEALIYLDDSATARAVMRRSTDGRGIAIEFFGTLDALRTFINLGGRVRAALLDVDLGEQNGAKVTGPEVARWLRELDARVPIAFYTSEPAALSDRELNELGAVFTKDHGVAAPLAWLATHAHREV